jgi:uncharacterized protein YecT (DUF1311 family)
MTSAGIGLLIYAVLVSAPAAATGPNPVVAMAGTWEVHEVAVDHQDQPHWRFRPNDPQLVGRTLSIDPERVTLNFSKDLDCSQTSWKAKPTTWGYLIAKGFPRPADGGRGAAPTPDDFELKVTKRSKVLAYPLCSSSGKTRVHFPAAPWLAVQEADKVAVNLDNQVLLILQRRPPDAKPTPSFDCGKATTPTEKAICGNFDLASWDRSVALALHQAIARSPEKEASLRGAQRDWLKKRDECAAKVECIDEQQWRRVEELGQE